MYFLLSILLLFASSSLPAADTYEFVGVKWGTSQADVESHLKKKYGNIKCVNANDGDMFGDYFCLCTGSFAGWDNSNIQIEGLNKEGAFTGVVTFNIGTYSRPNAYLKVRKKIISRYGEPTEENEIPKYMIAKHSKSYLMEQAIADGSWEPKSTWKLEKKDTLLMLGIPDNNLVMVAYKISVFNKRKKELEKTQKPDF